MNSEYADGVCAEVETCDHMRADLALERARLDSR